MKKVRLYEEFLNEGKYDYMSGLAIQFNGVTYTISSVEDDFVNVLDAKKNKKTFRFSAIVGQNPGVDVKPVKARPDAWNKGLKSDAYSTAEYQKILKGAVKDAGGSEFAHDMAQSMIYDPGIRARIEKDYPMLRNTGQMIQRLQYDLEMYESLMVEGVMVDTGRYERSHGKKPKGNGQWLFTYDRKAVDPAEFIEVPGTMNYADAAKFAAKRAKEDGKTLVYVLESETVYHQYDFLGMQAQAANMTREEWIAHYGTPDIGSGIE